MINYLRNKIRRHKEKRTFKEYGFEIKNFEIPNYGAVEYAQWLHPSESDKLITESNINFYKKLTTLGGMIIDIGAHTGDTTVPMALAVGSKGLVLGLEPNKYVFKILEKNAQLNKNHTNIRPLCFAATGEDGNFTFNYSDASFCNGGFLSQIKNNRHRHHYTLDVTGKNLQQYLQANHLKDLARLELIKIDAEGYDKEIVKAIPKLIEDYKPNIMLECYKRLTIEERNELYDSVAKHDYELYRLENFDSLSSMTRLSKSTMSDEKHFEILALHKSKSSQIRS